MYFKNFLIYKLLLFTVFLEGIGSLYCRIPYNLDFAKNELNTIFDLIIFLKKHIRVKFPPFIRFVILDMKIRAFNLRLGIYLIFFYWKTFPFMFMSYAKRILWKRSYLSVSYGQICLISLIATAVKEIGELSVQLLLTCLKNGGSPNSGWDTNFPSLLYGCQELLRDVQAPQGALLHRVRGGEAGSVGGIWSRSRVFLWFFKPNLYSGTCKVLLLTS